MHALYETFHFSKITLNNYGVRLDSIGMEPQALRPIVVYCANPYRGNHFCGLSELQQ